MAASCLSVMLEALFHQVGVSFACLVGGGVGYGGWTGVGGEGVCSALCCVVCFFISWTLGVVWCGWVWRCGGSILQFMGRGVVLLYFKGAWWWPGGLVPVSRRVILLRALL